MLKKESALAARQVIRKRKFNEYCCSLRYLIIWAIFLLSINTLLYFSLTRWVVSIGFLDIPVKPDPIDDHTAKTDEFIS